MIRARRRGTAIVDAPEGILVVSLDGRKFLTPGEALDAAIREL